MSTKQGSKFRLRISMRMAIILLTLSGFAIAIWTRVSKPAQLEAKAIALVEKHGGSFETDWRGPGLLDRKGYRFSIFNRTTSIQIPGEKLTDDDLKAFISLTELRTLSLTNAPLTDKAIAHLGQLKQLETLKISTTITPAALGQLETKLPHVNLIAGNFSPGPLVFFSKDLISAKGMFRTAGPSDTYHLRVARPHLYIDGYASTTTPKPFILELKNQSKLDIKEGLSVNQLATLVISGGSKLNAKRHSRVSREATFETSGTGSEASFDTNFRIDGSCLLSDGGAVTVKDWAKLDAGIWSADKNSKITIGNHFALHEGTLTLSNGSSMNVGNWAQIHRGKLELLGGNLQVEKWMNFAPESEIEISLREDLAESSALIVNGPIRLGGTLRIRSDAELAPDMGHEFEIIKAKKVNAKFAKVEFPVDQPGWKIRYEKKRVVVFRDEANQE